MFLNLGFHFGWKVSQVTVEHDNVALGITSLPNLAQDAGRPLRNYLIILNLNGATHFFCECQKRNTIMRRYYKSNLFFSLSYNEMSGQVN